jgi:sugar phosphate isomerase/epimerase
MKIGICAPIERADALKRAGLDFVEEHIQNFLVPHQDDAAFQPKRDAARAAPLPVPAANCFYPGAMKCVGPDVDVAALAQYAGTAFGRAQQVGLEIFVFGSGAARKIPDGWSSAKAFGQFVELLKQLGPLAQRHGVTIVVEPLNKGECNFINSVPEGAEVVRRVAHPNVMLLADIFHMLRDGQGPDDLVGCGPLLRHVHVAEREKRTAPGRHGDDFGPYLRALKQAGYDGRIAIESGWGDLAAEAEAAAKELRRQLADAGY